MANTSNSTLTTNFNVSPYWDDYDENKDYYRILYKPGYAVQARELTQSQTMMQKQISRFGRHIFYDGSIVIPGKFGLETDVRYVKIKDNDTSNNTIDVKKFENQIVTGTISGIPAYVIKAEDGSETDANTKTLMVRYLAANSLSNTITFTNGETITSNIGDAILLSANATGNGSIFTITQGVFFAKEHFISFPTQTVVLDRYGTNPTCQVGFLVEESIVTAEEDISLLDPALEASNYAAPGADRLKLNPRLVRLDSDVPAGPPDYVQLIILKDGIVQEIYERTQYSIIRDELAKRTSDESGDYYVNGLDIRVREHKDTGNNGGYDVNGNTSLLAIGIEPGTAYVKGYEINNLVTTYLPTEKAFTYNNVNSQIIGTGHGNYITLKEFVGAWKHDTGNFVYFYDTAQNRISDKKWSTSAQTGKLIGSAKIKNVIYNSGTLGTANGLVDLYMMDVQMLGTNAFSNVRSVYFDNSTTADMGGDVVLTSGIAVLNQVLSTLIYPIGSSSVRTLRDAAGNPDMILTFDRTTNITVPSTGAFNLSITTGTDEVFTHTGSFSTSQKQEILLNFNESFSISVPGLIAGTNGTNSITGIGSAFTRFNIGDRIEFSNVAGPTGTYIIASIPSDTSMTLTSNLNANASSNVITKVYKTGDIVDLTTKGIDAGATRTVSGTSSTLSFDLKETYGSSRSATITYKVSRTSAREIGKILKPNRYVQINCASAGTTGPFCLGFSDIYRVQSIRQKGSAFTSESQGTDVTDLFTIDNGQKDEIYDLGSIKPNGVSLSASDYLLVKLDYFDQNFTVGAGYFSVDSYPVNDSIVSDTTITTAQIPLYKSPTTGKYYDLRNSIDFRPVKTITAADATTVSSATTNPSSTATSFNSDINGLRLPDPLGTSIFDFSYYLPRVDMVAVDYNKTFSIIRGEPALVPITPKVPANLMSVARLFISPYPSISPSYAIQINRRDLAVTSKNSLNIRYTMRDIGVLKRRIENLEYYTQLSSLENEAINFQIVDDNGLNRFKNGIFVDSFVDYTNGDVYNPDFKIIVDPKEKSIRPLYTMDSFYYDYISGSGLQKTGDLVTLPYTKVKFIEQTKATTIRNIETTVYRFIGSMTLDPPDDNWVDTQFAPDNHIEAGPTTVSGNPVATTWNAWQTKVVGYQVEYGVGPTNGNEGIRPVAWYDFATLEEAQAKFNQLASTFTRFQGVWLYKKEQSTRTGTETTQTLTSDTTELNNTLVDVSLQLYIRPQVIKFNVKGLKPGTRFYTFFDGENMSNYVTQFKDANGYSSPLASNTYGSTSALIGAEGAALISDPNGEIYAFLRLPSTGKRFRVGTKEVKITDSPTNESFATSYATSYFVAQGLIEQKQKNILTTRKIINSTIATSQTGPVKRIEIGEYKVSCMAYSFLVKAPENEEGLFITGFDVYVAAKHQTLGVWFELREMDSSGGITTTSVPFSKVWVKSSDITTSTDGSVPLHVDFQCPIFLYNNIEYALVIHTEGINPDYYFFVSRLGGNDLITGTQVVSRPLTGTLYTTNNNLNFDIVPDLDLKVNFYRASFTTNSTGTGYLGNKPYEFLTVESTSSPLTSYGESMSGLDRLTLTGSFTANVGDRLIGQTSGVNTDIRLVSGSTYYSNGRGYVAGETLSIANANGMIYTGMSAIASSITKGQGILNRYVDNSVNATVYISQSNGNFVINDTIQGGLTGYTANVTAFNKFKYSVVDFVPEYINFNSTDLKFNMRVVSNNANAVSAYLPIVPKGNYIFQDEKAILSRTSELTAIGGEQSNKIMFTMATPTSYLSPVLDVGRTHTVYVHNIINSNTYNETVVTGGYLTDKYISKIITLAENQDAEDLSITLASYRPPSTDVKVWVRIAHAEDSEPISNKGWIEMECKSNTNYSSVSTENFIDYVYGFPASYMTGDGVMAAANSVSYTSGTGIVFSGYKQFQVKIGLLSDNSAIVPRVASLRSIALQL